MIMPFKEGNKLYKLRKKEGLSGIYGDEHPNWKGNDASYKSKHQWVRKHLPRPEMCPKCKIRKTQEVANIDGNYSRNLKTWEWLCIRCHRERDGHIERFIKNRPAFKMKGHLKGKIMPKETKEKISVKMKIFVKGRRRNERGMFI